MAVGPGTTLGHYTVLAPLGAGGMGEVWVAEDTKLKRRVALKILPAAFAANPDRLARFRREAEAVAALNHPNIVTIYSIEDTAGVFFLTMELVEGQSLDHAIGAGGLPLDQALEIGAALADALAATHAKGIVHRDLKPGNVMLAGRDQRVKVLDFGLAKMPHPDRSEWDPTCAPTLSAPTLAGVIMGTVGYMSPEQASGREVDFRSDQFSFGSLVYEMVTGRRAFARTSTAETLTAIIRENPEALRERRPDFPAQLAWILERCLAKDPDERYASTRDLARDLADLRVRLPEVTRTSPAVPGKTGKPIHGQRRLAWALVGVLAAAAVGGLTLPQWTARPLPLTYRALTFKRGVITGARFSPDGQTVYYSAAYGAEPPRVYVTRLEGTESVPLDLPPAMLLSVSSKGELAVLLTHDRNPHNSIGTLARVAALGGTPRPLVDDVIDADWAPDGERLAVVRGNYRIEFPPGHPVALSGQMPRVSPRGDRVAYLGDVTIEVIDLEGHAVLSHKMAVAWGLAWSPDGGALWATGSDEGGGADRVLYGLSLSGKRRLVAPVPGSITIEDVARDGHRALVTTGAGWSGIQATAPGQVGENTLDLFGRSELRGLSNDGRWALAYEYRSVERGSYLRSTDGARTVRVSDDEAIGLSPDGAWMLVKRTADPSRLTLVPTGAGTPQELDLGPKLRCTGEGPWARWSLDGRRLFVRLAPAGATEPAARIYLREGEKRWRPVTPEGVGVAFVASPDGRFVAARDRSGTVALFPTEGGEPRLLEPERGIPIQWSADGGSLYLAETRSGSDAHTSKEPLRSRVYRRELATGRIEPWRDIGPADPDGVTTQVGLFLTADGGSYAYSFRRVQNVLYLVVGLK